MTQLVATRDKCYTAYYTDCINHIAGVTPLIYMMVAGGLLTDPQVIHALAHGAVLLGDLLKVLVEAWLQRDKPRQRWEVRF